MKSDWMASATQMLVLLCQSSDRSKTGSAQYPGLFEWIGKIRTKSGINCTLCGKILFVSWRRVREAFPLTTPKK
jgi:hypothetical protein